MNTEEIINEEILKTMFEENFERLRSESGHSMSPDVKEAAWQQVRMYWKKLHHIAEKVTDTEIRLNLPDQKTPKERSFCIEGVVDIVREEEKVTMYDFKTHDLETIKSDKLFYEEQLNVYAFIWQRLHNQKLNETAIIATPLPDKMIEALRNDDPDTVTAELNKWNPIIPIPFDDAKVQDTIRKFGEVVDKIEEHRFRPPDLSKLESRDEAKDTFGTRVCRNCDARFSCDSYRQYAKKYKDKKWTKLSAFYDRPPEENEQIDREITNIPVMENAEKEAKE